MITRAERIKLFKIFARERDCPLCRNWPRAEKAARRWETTSFPAGICMRCDLVFWQSITVWVKDDDEMDALAEAVREDRRKGNPRPNGHELIKEIRERKATRH
jgi:hypothetical protein